MVVMGEWWFVMIVMDIVKSGEWFDGRQREEASLASFIEGDQMTAECGVD